MIYVGEHTRKVSEIMEVFESTVHGVNANYCDVNVHGVLLAYETYFINIIEVIFVLVSSFQCPINSTKFGERDINFN